MLNRVRLESPQLIYTILLILGAALAVDAIFSGIQRYYSDLAQYGPSIGPIFSQWYVLGDGGGGLAALVVTSAYGAAFMTRTVRPLAPIAYIVSYLICGIAFYTVLLSAGKEVSNPKDVEYTLVSGGFLFALPALVAATFGLVGTSRRKVNS